jgi:hypothetical protein
MIRNATSLTTDVPADDADSPHGRRDLQAGLLAQLIPFT